MNALATLPGQIETAHDACEFCLAGNAYLTLQSSASGARYTYRVRKIEDADDKWFVSLLTGPANEASYSYIGLLARRPDKLLEFRLTAKSKMATDSLPVRAFQYFLGGLNNSVIAPKLEVFHEGRCGRCARLLTVPESIKRGIGPECASKMGVA
jgi:hypothetical protein